MVFSSFEFLLYFLPLFFAVYFLVPKVLKNFVLFTFSLIFYTYGVLERPWYTLLMCLSVVVNYCLGKGMMLQEKNGKRKFILAVGLIYNFGLLFIFKYLDFVLVNINGLMDFFGVSVSLPLTDVVLPIGISFYTFQITSYLLDVYWNKVSGEKSLLTLGTYLCMFPQLIAGPIVSYEEVKNDLYQRENSLKNLEKGLRIFTMGLASKVLLANRVGGMWNQAATIGFASISTPMAWLSIIAYSLQIYFDFFGYSLMAMGLGRMMGFQFPKNFDYPYLAVSMTDFWRRWHITLGRWFREYIYIPLGGNKKAHYRNLWIVWILTGVWHGAGWNYILWGIFNGFLVTIEKLGLGKVWKRFPALGRMYMMLMIPLSWSLFVINDMNQWTVFMTRLFPFFGTGESIIFNDDYIKYLQRFGPVMLIALIFCTRLPRNLYGRRGQKLIPTLGLLVIFWLCIYTMYLGLDDPFLYFQF